MKRKNVTRSALFTSIISLLLCVSMLVGTTFAWFTDTVESGLNTITAGNLDIELEYYKDGEWKSVQGQSDLFSDELWEPGHTEVVYLRLSNKGTLAVKYHLGINVSETTGTNVANETFKLSDYIYMGVVEAEPSYTTREAAIEAAKSGANGIIGEGYSSNGTMLVGQAALNLAVVVYMPETVGNKANYKTGTEAPVINLGINLFATQEMYEDDSFGPDYDKGAVWTGNVDTDWYFNAPDAAEFVLTSGEELAGLAALVNGTAVAPVTTFAAEAAEPVRDDFQGQTIKLGANIDLHNVSWTPIGRIGTSSTDFTYAFKGTFDGQNYTISNLDVNAYGWAGVFGIAHSAEIKNLKVNAVSIRANRMAGAVVGQLYGSIENCHVANADIMVTPNAVGDSYDNGDKVGSIVGWLGDNGNNRTLTNCSANNVKLGAYRDVGGIAGYVASSTTVSGNKVDKLEIAVDQNSYFYGNKDFNAGAIYGRTGGTIVDENNTTGEEVKIVSTYSKDGVTYKQDGVSQEATLYMVPADYEGTIVNVAEGTTNIGGYAFAYNSNIEKIVLSSTVTTLNDRAFRDTSASEIVLNEGLKNISYQAFRNASNVKSVVIPSTVTTISKEAFQNSGITELTIPASVQTLEDGACRDMKNLSTVTIDSNADIPVYAFRACTNLKTVIITGENVTFGGGSRGMIFTNKENGDGSAITVYVASEAVKERLLAADTAAKDYGGYEILIATMPGADASKEEILKATDAALKNGGNVVLGANLKFNASETTAHSGYGAIGVFVNGGVLDGNGYKLGVNNWDTWDHAVGTTGGTIKNLTINSGMRGIFMGGATADVYIDNVTIDGTIYTFNSDGGNVNYGVYVSNSTLNGWTSFSNVHKEVIFTNCNFGEGQGYAFCRPYNAVTKFVNCVFETGFEFDTAYVSGIVFENCYYGDTLITAENAAGLGDGTTTFFYNGLNNALFN